MYRVVRFTPEERCSIYYTLIESGHQFKQSVVDSMDNDTVLFVIGDHGMTDNGDHGGDSEEEVTSAMFVYSRNRLVLSRFAKLEEIQQIDFVPTFSQLLGIPIPFSSLGSSVLSSTDSLTSSENISQVDFTTNVAALSVWFNMKQITRYIKEYSKDQNIFPQTYLDELSLRYEYLKSKFSGIVTIKETEVFITESRDYLLKVQEMCRYVWIQFDSFSMSRGLVSMFLALSLFYLALDGIPDSFFRDIIKGNFIWLCILSLLISPIIASVLYYKTLVVKFELTLYFSTCCISILILSWLVVSYWGEIAEQWYKLSIYRAKDPLNFVSRLIMLISSFALLSNSYIVEENFVAPFLLITIVWLYSFGTKLNATKNTLGKYNECSNKISFQSIRVKLIVLTITLSILIRLSFYYWQCREEQAKYCIFERKVSKTLLCVLTILSLATFIAVVRMCLRNIGNLVGWSPPIFVSKYFPSFSIVCCGCYWLLNSLPHKIKPKLFLPWQLQLFPQVVFVTSILAIIVLYIQPLCVFSTSNKHQNVQGNMIPTLFNKLKTIMMPGQNDDYPVVYGLATAYSAVFINISLFVCLLSAMLLGETLAIVTVIMVLSLLLLAVITAILKLEKLKLKENVLVVPWWSILCWSLSSCHFFYATGHHSSFPTIHWNSAGLFGDVTSTIVPGILVTLNTFISQIVHALLLPALMIAPLTLVAIWPKVFPLNDDFKKGELLLYEYKELRKQEMFSLTSKYILIQAFRLFMCMFSTCIHSRHLMVWKIFAPKFIFESVGFIVSLPFLFLGYCFVERISSKIFFLIETLRHNN